MNSILPCAPSWSARRAWKWYDSQPWRCGFNYLPASAISYTEMFMDYGFRADEIDKELAIAESVGFNALRIVLPYVVWEAEPAPFKARFDDFYRSLRGITWLSCRAYSMSVPSGILLIRHLDPNRTS
jgi:hypothetical protein